MFLKKKNERNIITFLQYKEIKIILVQKKKNDDIIALQCDRIEQEMIP